MAFDILNGCNVNEVIVVQKILKNWVFLKNFFNYLVSCFVLSRNITCFLFLNKSN